MVCKKKLSLILVGQVKFPKFLKTYNGYIWHKSWENGQVRILILIGPKFCPRAHAKRKPLILVGPKFTPEVRPIGKGFKVRKSTFPRSTWSLLNALVTWRTDNSKGETDAPDTTLRATTSTPAPVPRRRSTQKRRSSPASIVSPKKN